jgi:hypothetical protein
MGPVLGKYKVILFATLNYLEEHVGKSLVLDNYNPSTDFYQQERIQIEKYIAQRKIVSLQKKLSSLTKPLQLKFDLNFPLYIKEKTGYEIDLFEDLRNRSASIIAQAEIHNQKQLHDIGLLLSLYNETGALEKDINFLKALILNYHKKETDSRTKRNTEYTKILHKEINPDGESISVIVSNTPIPKHYHEKIVISPDNSKKIRLIQGGNNKHPLTYITIEFLTASAIVYQLIGLYTDIEVTWKDNATLIIKTKKIYSPMLKHTQIRSFENIVTIEYIEV